MATLFERVVGLDGEKIAIHPLRGLASEIFRGYRTIDDVVVVFSLTADQTTDLQRLLAIAASLSADNARRFIDWLFDLFALAEVGVMPDVYRNETVFWGAVTEHSWLN